MSDSFYYKVTCLSKINRYEKNKYITNKEKEVFEAIKSAGAASVHGIEMKIAIDVFIDLIYAITIDPDSDKEDIIKKRTIINERRRKLKETCCSVFSAPDFVCKCLPVRDALVEYSNN